MVVIRYVCLSDLHLGADNSLLTHLNADSVVDPLQPSAVLTDLISWLASVLREVNGALRPTLILNGDLLELALALDNKAIMAFERLLELLFPVGKEPLVADEIVFLPGNHDHHMWETARETQYAQFLQRRDPGTFLEPPWHATQMFNLDAPLSVAAPILNSVIDRYVYLRGRVNVKTVYPNYGILNEKKTKCVIFTHGHYVEPIYLLMTRLGNTLFPDRPKPIFIWDIEAENFAWIDFFWSAMGRSGDVGDYIERVYDMLLVPELRSKLAHQIGQLAGREWFANHPELGKILGGGLTPLVSHVLDRSYGLEKMQTDQALSPDAQAGLKWYVQDPLRQQLLMELDDNTPEEVTVIFGHTHKPFSATYTFAGFPGPTYVYNSGGWVVDTETIEPMHGGAIVLVDDELNVVSARMYNEAKDASQYGVRIESLRPSLLLDSVNQAADLASEQAAAFSKATATAVDAYHQNFKRRLDQTL